MDSALAKNIESKLKMNISVKRYDHILGVVDAAIYLARKYDANENEARIAALLHDYAKDFNKDQLQMYIEENGIVCDDIMKKTHALLHGKVAAHIAKNQFKIVNKDILNAVEYHTTGRKHMSKLEKIIYLADFIEIGRNYPGVEQLRIVAGENLDKAVIQALNNTILYVLDMGQLLHPYTIEARNQLLMEME